MRAFLPAVIAALLQIAPAAADDFSSCLQDADPKLKLAGCAGLISRRPDMAPAYCGRADALSDLGRTDEAIADYTRALAIDGKLAAAGYNRGLILLAQGNAKAALADFDAVIAMSLARELVVFW